MVMEFVKRVQYIYVCSACDKEYAGNETVPDFGVLGKIEFPNSAHGQRQVFVFWSCKEDMTHVTKAMKVAHSSRMEDVNIRRSRGEKFDNSGKRIKHGPIQNPEPIVPTTESAC